MVKVGEVTVRGQSDGEKDFAVSQNDLCLLTWRKKKNAFRVRWRKKGL